MLRNYRGFDIVVDEAPEFVDYAPRYAGRTDNVGPLPYQYRVSAAKLFQKPRLVYRAQSTLGVSYALTPHEALKDMVDFIDESTNNPYRRI